jgi:hypothetical protein
MNRVLVTWSVHVICPQLYHPREAARRCPDRPCTWQRCRTASLRSLSSPRRSFPIGFASHPIFRPRDWATLAGDIPSDRRRRYQDPAEVCVPVSRLFSTIMTSTRGEGCIPTASDDRSPSHRQGGRGCERKHLTTDTPRPIRLRSGQTGLSSNPRNEGGSRIARRRFSPSPLLMNVSDIRTR